MRGVKFLCSNCRVNQKDATIYRCFDNNKPHQWIPYRANRPLHHGFVSLKIPLEFKNKMQQTCKNCGRTQRFEFVVSDELWSKATLCKLITNLKKVQPYPYALCIECFLEFANNNNLRGKEIGLSAFYIVI